MLFSRAFSSPCGFVCGILFCGCASLWGAPQLSCGRSRMGCSTIVLRARACPLALYEVLPDCFASLLAHGVLPLQATGCSPLSVVRALYEVLSPTACSLMGALPYRFSAGAPAPRSPTLMRKCLRARSIMSSPSSSGAARAPSFARQ